MNTGTESTTNERAWLNTLIKASTAGPIERLWGSGADELRVAFESLNATNDWTLVPRLLPLALGKRSDIASRTTVVLGRDVRVHALRFLLEAQSDATIELLSAALTDKDPRVAVELLRRWNQNFNNSGTQPSASEVAAISQQLDAAASALPDGLDRWLRFALKPWQTGGGK